MVVQGERASPWAAQQGANNETRRLHPSEELIKDEKA